MPLLQRLTVDELHDEVVHIATVQRVVAHVVHVHDSRMIEPGNQPCLPPEAFDGGTHCIGFDQFRTQDLDGDPTTEDLVPTAVHPAHSAHAEFFLEPITAAQKVFGAHVCLSMRIR